jgi:hypothetical protein
MRNVMVDEHNMVTGILDWESAGWYPDYWEYAQIMRPVHTECFQLACSAVLQTQNKTFLEALIPSRSHRCGMVDEHNMVTGILDWESAGWYPDYWEYAQIMRPAFWGPGQHIQ